MLAEPMLSFERSGLRGGSRLSHQAGKATLDFPRFYFLMYAIVDSRAIYHLALTEHRTFCGLWIVGELHLVHEKPKDRVLCYNCERKRAKNASEHHMP